MLDDLLDVLDELHGSCIF